MTTPAQPHLDQPKKKSGCMKIGLIAIAVLVGIIILVAILVTAIGSGGISDEEQSTMIEGIVVPASAEADGSTDSSQMFTVPGADFEETSKWMGERLPDEVDGLGKCFAGRVSDDMHQWAWTNGSQGDWADHVVVTVGGTETPGQIIVSRGEDLVDCNLR